MRRSTEKSSIWRHRAAGRRFPVPEERIRGRDPEIVKQAGIPDRQDGRERKEAGRTVTEITVEMTAEMTAEVTGEKR